jgi:hypothetical protein
VLKKGGLWERYQHQIQQRRALRDAKKSKSKEVGQSDQFLHMIFDAQKADSVEKNKESKREKKRKSSIES